MKNLIVIILFYPFYLLCQEYNFDVNIDEGYIKSVYIIDENKVFKISETIDEIYVFSSSTIANSFLQTLNQNLIPQRKVYLGQTTIHLYSAISIEYYINDTPDGSSGQIKSINNIKFTYAPDNTWNRNSGVVGKITQVGNAKITYWTNSGYTEKSKYRGKIKTFKYQEFKYEEWSTWGEKYGMIGKPISIGEIKIKYFETDYDIGFKGNLKAIGTVNFYYFEDSYTNRKADIVGKFKEQKGRDTRLLIH